MELVEGRFKLGGQDLLSVAEEFGTPVYVYDGEKIVSQFNRLKNAFKKHDVKLKYACKALTNINILKLLREQGTGIDAVSINEVKLALKAGYQVNQIMFTPNCTEFSEIVEAIDLGVQINIDNLSFLERIGEEYGNELPVCVRINPHIQAGGNRNIQVGHVGSKFGISYLQFSEVLAIVEKYNILINGIHIHTGSDILDTEVFLKGAKVVFEAAKNFKDLEFLDFGSGFKVAYKESDHVTNIEELGQQLGNAFEDFCASYGKKLELWFEPGKFLVSEAGHFLATTSLIKESPACTFIGLNSGFNHLVRPMMYDSYHHIVNISNPKGEEKMYNIVGNICETDTFASDRWISKTEEGDVICFFNAGAYGFSMSSEFNSRLRPAEVLIYNGKTQLIRKRQIFEDLLLNQIEVDL